MNTDLTAACSTLGKSGIRVSRVCLGTMSFGNPIAEPQACHLVAHALDRGVNFFDTSNAYEGYDRSFGSAGGVGEELLGKALEGRRQQAVVCTKYANPVGLGPLDAGLSPKHLEQQLDNSLRRLRTDYIDVVLAHRWDTAAAIEEVWRVFTRWVESGKVLAVGVSNWQTWRMALAAEVARANAWAPLSVSSPKYNLLERRIEAEHIPCALACGVSLLTYQPFQGGLLTGKYRRGAAAPEGSRGAEMPDWMPELDDVGWQRVEEIQCLADEAGVPMSEYALAWLLSRPAVASVVVGCRTPDQLDAAVRASRRSFSREEAARVDAICAPAGLLPGQQVLKWTSEGWKLSDSELA